MSYDFWLEIDAGGSEPIGVSLDSDDKHPILGGHEGRCGNYTYNVCPILVKCLGYAGKQVSTLRELDGTVCNDLIPVLKEAVDKGIENLVGLKKLDPPNGWGNAEGAIVFLWDILRMCEKYPKCTLRIT